MTLYGIRNRKTKNPLRISIFSNEGSEDCNSCGAMFVDSEYTTTVYIVTDRDYANRCLLEDPHWFNASTEWPQWFESFDPKNYEVFTVTL